jgi:hypothetical protein
MAGTLKGAEEEEAGAGVLVLLLVLGAGAGEDDEALPLVPPVEVGGTSLVRLEPGRVVSVSQADVVPRL